MKRRDYSAEGMGFIGRTRNTCGYDECRYQKCVVKY